MSDNDHRRLHARHARQRQWNYAAASVRELERGDQKNRPAEKPADRAIVVRRSRGTGGNVRVAGNIVVVAIAVVRHVRVAMRCDAGTRAATVTILVRPMEMIVRQTADGKRQQIGGGR